MHRYLRTRLGHPLKQFFLLQLRGVCHSRGCGGSTGCFGNAAKPDSSRPPGRFNVMRR